MLEQKRSDVGDFAAPVQTTMDNLYVLHRGRQIYTSPRIDGGPVNSCSASISVGVGRERLDVVARSNPRRNSPSATRPPDMRGPRAIRSGIVRFQFDPDHPDFPRFRAIPVPQILTLTRSRFSGFEDDFQAAYRGDLTMREASMLFDRVATVAFACFPDAAPVDPRVAQVIAMLRENRRRALPELAAAVGLSYHRLSHLFSENIGMPLRSYQRWQRLRRAISLFRNARSFTVLARDAGFTDPAHFCRTFRQLLGAPPSHFLRSSRVRIHLPEAEVDKAGSSTIKGECVGQSGTIRS